MLFTKKRWEFFTSQKDLDIITETIGSCRNAFITELTVRQFGDGPELWHIVFRATDRQHHKIFNKLIKMGILKKTK